jgi:hypothetical protein
MPLSSSSGGFAEEHPVWEAAQERVRWFGHTHSGDDADAGSRIDFLRRFGGGGSADFASL